MRGGATVALVGVVLLVGALTLRAAGGGGDAGATGIAGLNQHQSRTTLRAGAVPTGAPTDTPVPAPTATATSAPPPAPTATATPVPGPITFTCASGAAVSGEPTNFAVDVCLATTPGAVVSVTASTCADDPYGNVWSDIHVGASGQMENRAWTLRSTCGLPLTVTLSASGTAPDGSALAGSGSFTIAG